VLGKHALKPKEKTELKIIYNTVGRPGAFRKNINITTNVPGQEEIEMTMSGVVREAPGAKIQVAPRKFDFGAADAGAVVQIAYTVTNAGALPLIISRIYSQERRDVYFDGADGTAITIDPGKSQTVRIELKPSKPGPYADRVVIASNAKNATKGNYIVMVSGQVK
jgi:hypothetical protein